MGRQKIETAVVRFYKDGGINRGSSSALGSSTLPDFDPYSTTMISAISEMGGEGWRYVGTSPLSDFELIFQREVESEV